MSNTKFVNIARMCEEKKFIQILNESYEKYFKYGPRSSKKVDHFHQKIVEILETKFNVNDGYKIKLEYNIKSFNSSGKKKCDIVILKNEKPYIIIPVKLVMTNYKQNKNNSWENLTGELSHLKWHNPDIFIVPINIFMNKTPYLKSDKKIKHFENITMNDIENYDELIKRDLCYDLINHIVETDHTKKEEETFDEMRPIKKFKTEYKSIDVIFKDLL